MVAVLLGSVPIALIYAFFLKYYIKGITAGGVKGWSFPRGTNFYKCSF
jgi:ABC-type maltose transport system permease subunit